MASRRWYAKFLYHVGPDVLFLAFFGLLLLLVSAAYKAPLTSIRGSTFLPLIALGVLLAVAFGIRLPAILSGDRVRRAEFFRLSLGMLRDWSPLILIILIY